MTLIVAAAYGEDQWAMAADSGAEHSELPEVGVYHTPKVFKLNKYCAVGVSGSYRLAQIIAHRILGPTPILNPALSPLGYMLEEFIPALQRHADSIIQESDPDIVVVCQGQLFEIDRSYHVIAPQRNWTAVGSGAPYATGICQWLTTVRGTANLIPEFTDILSATAQCTYTVRPPFTVIEA